MNGYSRGMDALGLAHKWGLSLKTINKEIRIGTKVEFEHSNDDSIARRIAMDHIYEHPDYYTNPKYGLVAMERNLDEDRRSKGKV